LLNTLPRPFAVSFVDNRKSLVFRVIKHGVLFKLLFEEI